MAFQKYITFTFICLYLCYKFDVISAAACDKSKCKGPMKYYEDLKCTPIYGSNDPCCPVEFNCDHLKERSADKCYMNGKEYEIGEALKAEDATPCQKGCTCVKSGQVAQFHCAVVDCFQRAKPGCYLKASHNECCDGPEEVCPQSGPKVAECKVDGKTYHDGQRFSPASEPTLSCICSAGYKGENLSPFCKPDVPFSCGAELRDARNVQNNCSPVFYSNQNPATDCHTFSRCQLDADRVLRGKGPGSTAVLNPGSTCSFGKLTMKLGDELNQATGYDSVCVKCVCQVPPFLTCQRLPDDVCDVTVHPKFDNFDK